MSRLHISTRDDAPADSKPILEIVYQKLGVVPNLYRLMTPELRGADAAQSVQLVLEYAPAPPFDAGLPETAPPHIRNAVTAQMESLPGDGRKRVEALAERNRGYLHTAKASQRRRAV